jgi:hypothetical protein
VKPATRQVLDFLRVRGADGASEAEIQSATAIRSGAQRVHELRRDGYVIETVYERSPIGARFARFVLLERPTFRPVSGVQEGLALS